jgi:proteasome lid subunit RPN8/RPN11
MGLLSELNYRMLRRQRLLPPRLGKLTISREIYDQLMEHVIEGGRDEVCGVFGIIGTDIVSLHRVANVHDTPYTNYSMDAKQHFLAMKSVEDNGGEVAFYHSHTHSIATPSPTDMRLAQYPDSYFLIASPHTFSGFSRMTDESPIVRAFSIRPRKSNWLNFLGWEQFEVTEEPVVITS